MHIFHPCRTDIVCIRWALHNQSRESYGTCRCRLVKDLVVPFNEYSSAFCVLVRSIKKVGFLEGSFGFLCRFLLTATAETAEGFEVQRGDRDTLIFKCHPIVNYASICYKNSNAHLTVLVAVRKQTTCRCHHTRLIVYSVTRTPVPTKNIGGFLTYLFNGSHCCFSRFGLDCERVFCENKHFCRGGRAMKYVTRQKMMFFFFLLFSVCCVTV